MARVEPQSRQSDTWTREDGSIIVDPGHARHVDISTDGGDSWDALHPAEARAMAFALIEAASTVEVRDAIAA